MLRTISNVFAISPSVRCAAVGLSSSSQQKLIQLQNTFRQCSSNSSNNEGNSEDDPKKKLNSLLQSIKKEEANKQVGKNPLDLTKPPKEKISKSRKEAKRGKTNSSLSEEVIQAVDSVTEAIKDKKNRNEIKNDLVERLKSHSSEPSDLTGIFSGMKIEKHPIDADNSEKFTGRSHRVRETMKGESISATYLKKSKQRLQGPSHRGPKKDRTEFRLNSGTPLGIFKKSTKKALSEKIPNLETWDKLYEKELRLCITHPPANGFEEMILWTEQKKLWNYPINNEQSMGEEANTPFTEHIFLEPKIDSWCPSKGPIRHFMQLVCVGLSKNPYLSAKDKEDHLEWYHQYFKGKESIIKEVGAGEIK